MAWRGDRYGNISYKITTMTPLGMIVIWLLVIELKVAVDWWQIVKLKQNIKHGFELLAVIFIYILYGIFVAQIRAADTWAQDVTVFAASAYWLLFDGLLSWHRGFNFFYLGKNAASDRFWTRWGFGSYVMTKVFALVGVIYGIVNILQHG